MRCFAIVCSLLITLAAHAQDASVLLAYVTAETGPAYQQVAYIETVTNSWLITGVDSSDDLEVQTRIKPLEFPGAYKGQVFGSYKSETNNTFRMLTGVSASIWLMFANTKTAGGGTSVSASKIPYGAWTSVMLKRWQYACNSETNSITQKLQGTVYNGPMQISSAYMKCRYAYFRMLKSGVLVFNGIPVIAPNGQGAMYDTVSKRLIENSGEGTITYGLIED